MVSLNVWTCIRSLCFAHAHCAQRRGQRHQNRGSFRALNQSIVKDAHEIPLILEFQNKMKDAKIVSTLDLKSGFHQIPLAKEDRQKTTLCTSWGSFHYTHCCFKLSNSPRSMQRLTDCTFWRRYGFEFLMHVLTQKRFWVSDASDFGCAAAIMQKMAISGDHSRYFPKVSRQLSASIPLFPENCWDCILPPNMFVITSKEILTWWCIAITNHWLKLSAPALSVTMQGSVVVSAKLHYSVQTQHTSKGVTMWWRMPLVA